MRYWVFLLFALSCPLLSQKAPSGKATSSGPCSPAISGDNNVIKLDGCGISSEQGKKIIDLLRAISSDRDIAAMNVKLDEMIEIAGRGQQTIVNAPITQQNTGGCNQQVVGGNGGNTNNCPPPDPIIASSLAELVFNCSVRPNSTPPPVANQINYDYNASGFVGFGTPTSPLLILPLEDSYQIINDGNGKVALRETYRLRDEEKGKPMLPLRQATMFVFQPFWSSQVSSWCSHYDLDIKVLMNGQPIFHQQSSADVGPTMDHMDINELPINFGQIVDRFVSPPKEPIAQQNSAGCNQQVIGGNNNMNNCIPPQRNVDAQSLFLSVSDIQGIRGGVVDDGSSDAGRVANQIRDGLVKWGLTNGGTKMADATYFPSSLTIEVPPDINSPAHQAGIRIQAELARQKIKAEMQNNPAFPTNLVRVKVAAQ